jgi:hypothetical protein
MLLVREVFIAKPGHAGELSKMMKENMKGMPASMNVKVMLDSVTDYNKIVVEYEVESLAAFEQSMNQEKSKQQSKPKDTKENPGPKYTDLYLTGKREIFRLI